MSWIALLAAFFALFDLFNGDRTKALPWWGDVIVLFVAAATYITTRKLLGDDD